MAIEVGDKIYRNLPEQVEWLSNQFVRILEAFEELGTVMRYKGSVATYADLPADNNKVGDVYNVIDTGSNYAWDGEGWDEIGSTVDLSNLVTLDTAQTITGVKTLKEFYVKGTADDNSKYHITSADWNLYIRKSNDDILMAIQWNDCVFNQNLRPGTYNTQDLGSSTHKWKDLYLAGNLYLSGGFNPNSSGYGLTLPDTTNWTANKEIPTTDQTFNVINASDIVNNTLTQAQYDLITNGKPTLIKGTWNSIADGLFSVPHKYGNSMYGTYQYGGRASVYGAYQINVNSLVLDVVSATDNFIQLKSISSINSKNFPAYPTTNTVPQVLTIGASGGALSWQDSKPTTVSLPIDNQTNTADISSYSGKIVVLYAADTAGGTWEVTFTLPSTIIAVGITKSGSTQIEISGTSITNHTLKITNLDELDMSAFCVIDLSDGLTAKVMAGRNF